VRVQPQRSTSGFKGFPERSVTDEIKVERKLAPAKQRAGIEEYVQSLHRNHTTDPDKHRNQCLDSKPLPGSLAVPRAKKRRLNPSIP
jgi:hypothetical protein